MKEQGFEVKGIFSGLSRQVLLWFLVLSLLPLCVNSWMSYQSAREQLHQDTLRALADVSTIQSRVIRADFERVMTDLVEEAERQSNNRFLNALINGYQLSGKAPMDFVGSYQWTVLSEDYGEDLQAFWKLSGYYDIYLIDREGNVLYSYAQESDLGQNLLIGPLSSTRFAKAAEDSLRTGRIVFSDLEKYGPSNYGVSGFLMNPILNEIGEKVGLIAFQISGSKLKELVQQDTHFGETGRRYLIGPDLTLRTPGVLGDEFTVLDRPVKTENTLGWSQGNKEPRDEIAQLGAEREDVLSYRGPNGETVLGIHTNIDIAGVSWGYIAEIDSSEALAASHALAEQVLLLISATAVLVLLISLPITRSIVRPIARISQALAKVGAGDLKQTLDLRAKHELGDLTRGFNSMLVSLQQSDKLSQNQNWLQEGASQLKDKTQGNQTLSDLARETISFLCQYLDSPIGIFYVVKNDRIKLMGSYAFNASKGFQNEFGLGEGLVGQAALDQKNLLVSEIPEDYLAVSSGLGEASPRMITVTPLIWNNEVVAVLEFGTVSSFDALHEQLLELVSTPIAVAVQTSLSRDRTQELLEQTQAQAEELQAREEELRDSNSLLEQHAKELKRSEEILRNNQTQLEERNEQLQAQQEELRVANEELEEKAQDLRTSRDVVESKNKDLEQTRGELEDKAEDLALASRYKSEFLANMSHELRTPLNSLLILSKLLADNKGGNLDSKQVEFANTIHDSGRDLLELINDILDLSKIESGKVEVHIESVGLRDFVQNLDKKFRPMADDKGIEFIVETNGAPDELRSDGQKLDQIVKNLLSNAVKFTEQGSVTLKIGPVDDSVSLHALGLTKANSLAFSVIDSGIGIAEDTRKAIFEAFQQADGTTSRKYGGTGLGLSISRELARMLGGEIHVESETGKGSIFTLYTRTDLSPNLSGDPLASNGSDNALFADKATVQEGRNSQEGGTQEAIDSSPNNKVSRSSTPQAVSTFQAMPINSEYASAQSSSVAQAVRPTRVVNAAIQIPEKENAVPDDRADISPEDRSILIIEDDVRFSPVLADAARERGFKVLIAGSGEAGLQLADTYEPSGIILDIGLPGIDGWQVMERLKDNLRTRHIPVHFISGNGDPKDAFKNGAVGFLTKPVSMEDMATAFGRIEDVIDRPVKRLLLVEDDPALSMSLKALIGYEDVDVVLAKTGLAAKEKLEATKFDCIVLDLGLPDMSGLDVLEAIRCQKNAAEVPVIVYTGKELEPQERASLDRYAQSIIIKNVRSPERLLDDTGLFLHRLETHLPEDRRSVITMLHDKESVFEGRKVLVVDDDMRNVFALSATLQDKNMEVIVAKNGVEALSKIELNPDVDIVLMDIMMPEMDGYEATRRIRAQSQFTDLPIVALTAKAMKGDRTECIKAGASDYMAKPISTEKLLSIMRVWLYR